MLQAKDALRGLMDRITLKTSEPSGKLSIHFEGALAEPLLLSLDTKKEFGMVSKNQATEYIGELVLVAGGRIDKYLPLYKGRHAAKGTDPPTRKAFGTHSSIALTM